MYPNYQTTHIGMQIELRYEVWLKQNFCLKFGRAGTVSKYNIQFKMWDIYPDYHVCCGLFRSNRERAKAGKGSMGYISIIVDGT